MGWAIKAADEFGIPEIQFWTASACSFMAYLHFTQLLDRDIIPFKGDNFTTDGTLDTPIDWIPGMPDIRLKDMPSFIHKAPAGVLFDFLSSEAQNCLNSSAIIFNTYDEFEDQVLEAIKAKGRQNALEWQQRAMNATDVGGSSYNNFDRFIKNMSPSTDTTSTYPSI
ncbi:hypothetical protein ACFE04_020840 [Oxalis oulophora]